MADSWEDIDEQPHAQASAERKAPAGGLNPNASSFNFNPSASTFTPSFAPKPQATTAPAQPIQESSAPSGAQSQSHEQQQPHHADTNGFADHKQDAQPMQVDPPSERDTPVTSASTPAQHADEHMQEADAPSGTAGLIVFHTRESNFYLCLLSDKLQHLSRSDATCRVKC